MGMSDTIHFNCLKCGNKMDAQSKSGDCSGEHYYFLNVPLSVALDANRHAPFRCQKCGSIYEFEEADNIENTQTVSLRINMLLDNYVEERIEYCNVCECYCGCHPCKHTDKNSEGN